LVLILLIAAAKWHPFIAFLLVSLVSGWGLGIPLGNLPGLLEKGMGSTLGSAAPVLFLGAMFGKLVAISGAAQRIATGLISFFGRDQLHWAFLLTGFVIGLPLFYNAGFVLLVPLVLTIAYQYRLSAVFVGIPLLAALSITHGFLPPHPAPTALIPQFGADTGRTLLYGLVIAVPVAVLSGPVFAQRFRHFPSPSALFQASTLEEGQLPGHWFSLGTALFPVFILSFAAFSPWFFSESTLFLELLSPFKDTTVVMLLAVLLAAYTLGVRQGRRMAEVMDIYGEGVKDIAGIVLIIAGAGALKQVLVESGFSNSLAVSLQQLPVPPLVLAWLVATVIRIAVGSATVAGLTAAGLVAPMAGLGVVDPNLLVLAIGAGSLMCSRVNDSGFWMFKAYFNLSLRDTFRTWTLMETLVGVLGLLGVLLLDYLL
jgi:Gnt-I system high-affinity gluconate transporter